MGGGGGKGGSSSEQIEPRFQLVICDRCNLHRVKHYVSRTDENYLRHFYKCPNHGSHKGGCNFWKWEDVYEEHLQKIGEIGQDPTEASSSMNQFAGRVKKGKMETVSAGSTGMQRQLIQIVLLLKFVIFCLGIIICLMVMLVCKQ